MTRLLVGLSFLFCLVEAFLPVDHHVVLPPRMRRTSVGALIFDENGYSETTEASKMSFSDQYGDTYGSMGFTTQDVSSIMQLLSTQYYMMSLARMAAAFAPLDHNLKLDRIDSVFVSNIDNLHIEIVAILCEHEECVQVQVPVDYPQSCTGEGYHVEECILENLEVLDSQAQAERSNAIQSSLEMEPEQEEMPLWWTQSGCQESLATECDSLKDFFNANEFRDDLRLLAKRHASGAHDIVLQACIAAVGPSGVMLRAQLAGAGDDHSTTLVTIPFDSTADSVDDLRESIISLVTSIDY